MIHVKYYCCNRRDDPTAPYPGNAKSLMDFQQIADESGKNTLIMNSKIVKDICKPVFLHRQKVESITINKLDYADGGYSVSFFCPQLMFPLDIWLNGRNC